MGKYFSDTEKRDREKNMKDIVRVFLNREMGINKLDIPFFQVNINSRLKKTMGRYRYTAVIDRRVIEMNASLLKYNNEGIILDVLKHEAIHMGLHIKGLPHGDNDKEFIDTCNRLGVGLTETNDYNREVHCWECPECGNKARTQRKPRKTWYSCAKCGSGLELDYKGKTIGTLKVPN